MKILFIYFNCRYYGLLIVACELGHEYLARFFSFEKTYVGKGAFFVFTGKELFDKIDDKGDERIYMADFIAGCVIIAWGVFIYIIGSFCYLDHRYKEEEVVTVKIRDEEVAQPPELEKRFKEKRELKKKIEEKEKNEKEINELKETIGNLWEKVKDAQFYEAAKDGLKIKDQVKGKLDEN